jgi:hypothetical protein
MLKSDEKYFEIKDRIRYSKVAAEEVKQASTAITCMECKHGPNHSDFCEECVAVLMFGA